MQEFLSKHWKKLLAGGFACAAAFFLIKISRNYSRKQFRKPEEDKCHLSDYEKKEIKIPEFPQLLINDLAKQIPVLFERNLLKMKTLTDIWEKSVDLIKEEYVKMIIKNRKDRRKVFYDDKNKYILLVIHLMNEIEDLLKKGQDDLLRALNFKKDLFENSLEAIFTEGMYDEMMMIQVEIRYKLK